MYVSYTVAEIMTVYSIYLIYMTKRNCFVANVSSICGFSLHKRRFPVVTCALFTRAVTVHTEWICMTWKTTYIFICYNVLYDADAMTRKKCTKSELLQSLRK